MKNKKAFSFVEIIIVITILALIWIVVTKISWDSATKTQNAKIEADLNSISNALLAYNQKNKDFPLPDGNRNYYKNNWAYSHENFEDLEKPAFWVYGIVPEKDLKEFLSEIPKDPRTNQFYAYGRTKETWEFEVVWVEKKSENFLAKVIWNYKADKGISGLVREYNWPYFITDGSNNLPFNPEKILLSATDLKWNIFNEDDILEYKDWKIYKNNTLLENIEKSEEWKFYDLYISDWSIARLDLSENVKLTFWKDNSIFAFIKWADNKKSSVNLFLEAGSAWVFAWDLNESELNAETRDIVAAVRWTVFKINSKNEVIVYKWKVEIIEKNSGNTSKIIEWNNKDDEIPYLKEEEKNITIKLEKAKIENKFIALYYENWKILEKKDIALDENNIWDLEWNFINWKYYWIKDWKYFLLKKENEKIFLWNEINILAEIIENQEKTIYISDTIYDWSCFEINKETILNKCEQNYAEILKWYKKEDKTSQSGTWISNSDTCEEISIEEFNTFKDKDKKNFFALSQNLRMINIEESNEENRIKEKYYSRSCFTTDNLVFQKCLILKEEKEKYKVPEDSLNKDFKIDKYNFNLNKFFWLSSNMTNININNNNNDNIYIGNYYSWGCFNNNWNYKKENLPKKITQNQKISLEWNFLINFDINGENLVHFLNKKFENEKIYKNIVENLKTDIDVKNNFKIIYKVENDLWLLYLFEEQKNKIIFMKKINSEKENSINEEKLFDSIEFYKK